MVGIPLTPGFHVLEIASQRLGESLLDARYGASRTMYVRTSALVTNLAVHFKLGRENSLAWVTTLDKGQVVPGAEVRVSTCRGEELATAVTDANGESRRARLRERPLEGVDLRPEDEPAPLHDASDGRGNFKSVFTGTKVVEGKR